MNLQELMRLGSCKSSCLPPVRERGAPQNILKLDAVAAPRFQPAAHRQLLDLDAALSFEEPAPP